MRTKSKRQLCFCNRTINIISCLVWRFASRTTKTERFDNQHQMYFSCMDWSSWKSPNLADYKSEHVRRWIEANSPPNHLQNNNILTAEKILKQNSSLNNNNTIEFLSQHHQHQGYWRAGTNKEDMPMLLQQPPSHVLLASAHHDTPDQPLDFTMSKFKTKSATTVASQLKQLNSFTAQQQMMLLQSNGMYFNRSNNNKSFTRGSSPSSSSEEEGVGPPASSPRSSLPSPGPLRGDGKGY